MPVWCSDREAWIDVAWLALPVETRLQHATQLRAILGASP
jgi:hypothetical protein